ncbi:hypothetical protein BYT27DRAFT_7216408 [Phlegmacium glaucopus]|nr:hypothetical protein BYT27DRAFT_7216408 [Phlegmacium glaucopus]
MTSKGHKRKRGRNPMVEGDTDLAKAVTCQTISETQIDGTTVQKWVWVSMDTPKGTLTAIEKEREVPAIEYEPAHMSPPTERTHSYQTQKDYLGQYIDCMDEFLEAFLSWEAMPDGIGMCQHCQKNVLAVWFLEDMEEMKDNAEQDQLCWAIGDPLGPAPAPYFDEDDEFDMEEGTNRGEEEDDDDECDDREDLKDPTIPHPYLGANAGAGPDSTMLGTYVRIIHSNGLHHIVMLLPASFKHIKTVFTAEVLDLYRLCNLELTASAYQFYQLMHRLTRPMALAEVTNLYRELCRMSRVWCWMKKLKWAHYAGTDSKVNEVGARDLAIYCPACPQAGISIPGNWKDDPAWQVKSFPRNPAGDMWLSEGSGMMPRNDEYMDFLASTIERLTVGDFSLGANITAGAGAGCSGTGYAFKLCDVTGLISIACGWHGCYAPQALVDLFRGEQQKNIDFALLNALKSTHVQPEQGVLLIYDIALVIASEIMESLWSSLNAISLTACTATLAHQAEMLDNHATDSNHKKTLGIISSLCRSNRTAVDMLDHARTYYQNLMDQASITTESQESTWNPPGICEEYSHLPGIPGFLEDSSRILGSPGRFLEEDVGECKVQGKWTQDVEQAEVMRKYDVSVMDMYAAQMDDVLGDVPQPAPGMPRSPLASWMEMSLAAEEKQLEIQAKVRQLSRKAGSIDWQTVELEHEQLAALLSKLKNAMHLAGVSESNQPALAVNESLEIWDEIVNKPVPTGPNTVSAPADPPAPSNTIPSFIGPPAIEDQWIPLLSNGKVRSEYCALELSHRLSHADHHLNHIRELIAEKSFQFSHIICVSPRKGVNTHSRAAVKKLNLKISVHCWLYTQCQAHLVILGAGPATLSRFKNLTLGDVKASTAIVNLNEPGSTHLTLSWLWQTASGHCWGLATGHVASADAMPDTNIVEFRRVHWLRARAQLMRWEEEVTLTRYKMQWTVRYFLFKSLAWAVPPGTGTPGPQHQSAGSVAYARQQQASCISTMSIHQFNPFSVQQGFQDSTLLHIQEVIYYAESHFWSIVNDISKAEIDRQSWAQKLLHRELLFVLSYVGIASTLGQAIEIPIIVRSLADSIRLLHEDALPLSMDPGFLAILDMGAHGKDNKSRVTNTTIGISVSASAGTRSPARIDAPSTAGTSVPPTAGTSVLASADPVETRPPPGLYIPPALLKETSGCAPPASGTTAYQIENVAWKALSELSCLQSMPATSYKWTWGETLTKKEVLALRRTGTRLGAVPHSGYDLSLVESRMLDEYTADLPSHPTLHGQNENVPAEAVFVPPNSELSIPLISEK